MLYFGVNREEHGYKEVAVFERRLRKGSICMSLGNACGRIVDFDGTGTNRFEMNGKKRARRNSGGRGGNIVSFLLVAKTTVGFRESAGLVAAAKHTGCVIRLAAGKNSGSSESIFSLARMGITAGTSVVLTIEGEAREAAFHEVQKILNGEGSE